MDVLKQALALTHEALKEIDNPNIKLSAVIRKAIRIASLRNDFKNLGWLSWEMQSMTKQNINMEKMIEVLKNIEPQFLPDEFTDYKVRLLKNYIEERKLISLNDDFTIKKQAEPTGLSVSELELQIEQFESLSQSTIPKGISGDYAYIEYKQKENIRSACFLIVNETKSVLERIKQRVSEFLSQTEKELSYGQVQSSIFEENRIFVDEQLSKVCPEAIKKFISVYQRLKTEEEEDWSQALTSCRRILKDFADVIYPPTNKPVKCHNGKERVLGQDKYINRLWQFAYANVNSKTTQEVLKGQIDYLGTRIDALYKLTTKGVHEKVDKFDVNQCVIFTYLLLGDLLRIYKGGQDAKSKSQESN